MGHVQRESAPRKESQIKDELTLSLEGKDRATQSWDIKKEGRRRHVFNDLQHFVCPRSYYMPGKVPSIPLKGRICCHVHGHWQRIQLELTSRVNLRLDIRNVLSKDNVEPPNKTNTLVWERKQ